MFIASPIFPAIILIFCVQHLVLPAKQTTKTRLVNSCKLQRDEVHPVLMQQGYVSMYS